MEKDFDPWPLMAQLMATAQVTGECLQVLIATHPQPQRLQAEWQRRIAGIVDGEMDTGPFDVQPYRDALLRNMRGLSETIDAAARIHQRPR